MAKEERLINRNPYLYGPGPVRRVPTGMFSFYAKLPPRQGFMLAALTGCALGFAVSMSFKVFIGDPQLKAVEDYYKENPPR